jgi:membrane protein implicated in regulation of membrane protease activity
MTRIIRDVLLVLIVAIVLIFLGGAVLDWVGGGTDNQPGYISLAVWTAWDAGILLLLIAVVWLWRRYRRHGSTNGTDAPAP